MYIMRLVSLVDRHTDILAYLSILLHWHSLPLYYLQILIDKQLGL